MVDDVLRAAINLIKAGEKADARKILEPYIMANPHNIQAWLWEAETRESVAGKIKTLEMCLQQNPEEPQVKKVLALLKARQEQLARTNVQSSVTPQVTLHERVPENSTRNADNHPNQAIHSKLKPCPYCAEMIQETAKVCRFCGRELPLLVQSSPPKKLDLITIGIISSVAVILLIISVIASTLYKSYKLSNTPGSLEGVVTWETQGAGNVFVVGVTVKVWANGREVQRTITDSDGKYEIKALRPGTYIVSVYQPASTFGEQIAEKCWVFNNIQIQPQQATKLFMDYNNAIEYRDPLCEQNPAPPSGVNG